jgi:hypothetical protein
MVELAPSASVRRSAVLTVLLLLVGLAVVVLPGGASGAVTGTSGAHAAAVPNRPVSGAKASTTGPGYAFASVLDGRPVRWNPCSPVRWTANLAGAPRGGLDVLKAAVARVAAASGTTWTYVGPTTTRPTSGVLPRTARTSYPPVVLGWADGRSSDLLRGQPKGVLAMTRTAWFGVRKPDGSKVAALRSAVVAFDRTDRLPLRGAVSWQAVALHELGHVMGLAHVGDRRQLMATVLPRAVADLQLGDRAGLAKVGRAAGCVHVPS